MKKIFYTLIAASLILGACHPTYVVEQSNRPAPAPTPVVEALEVSYQNFYDELSPYGHWIDYPGYGYVWMPAAGPDFRPYATNGYWIYTDMGWTWTSNYSWGWAPFHYGRWFYEGGYGWMWIPGNEWSPAWVSWRTNNDYYGWAPLGPNVRMDVYGGSYNPPSNYWCFVPHQYIANPRVSNYYVNETRNVTIINNTTIINSRVVNVTNNNNTRVTNNRTVYVNGPDRQEVERVTGSPIRPAVIRENNRPGEQVNNGQYTIYRPHVNSNAQRTTGNQTVRVAPSRVESLRDIRPTSSTSNLNSQANNQPVIRSNNNNNNTEPSNNNSNVRPSENLPASNNNSIRSQQNVNGNGSLNNRNNNNPAPSNNSSVRSSENLPASNNSIRSQQNVNSNESLNNRTNNNSTNNRPANTRTTVVDNRPVNNNNNNVRVNTTPTNTPPANNNSRSTNNNVRNNSSNHNASQNNNKSAEEIKQMRKASATNPNATRPVEKKEKKEE